MLISTLASRMMRKKLAQTRYTFQPMPERALDGPYGIYFHVPFCPTRCNYCPFYSERVSAHSGKIQAYTEAVIREIEPIRLKRDADWLYFGGGTPNLLSIDHLKRILHAVRLKVDPGPCGIELLPALVDQTYLEGLVDLGFSKISMGVQTFTEPVIRQTGRKYVLNEQLKHLVEAAQALGLWVSLDLMVGLAGQTPDQFHQDILNVLEVHPDQIAIYPFIKVSGVRGQPQSTLTSEQQYGLIESAHETLSANGFKRATAWIFSRNETSTYDSSGSEIGMEYIGFGAGAYSVCGKLKMMNPPLDAYLHGLENDAPMAFVSPRKKSSEDMRRISKMIYGLRLEKFSKMGWMTTWMFQILELCGYSQRGILTPKGRLLSHEISKAAMEALPFPIQDPSSIENQEFYQKYCLALGAKGSC